jgi:outer membrane protein assembly factor BamB
LAAPGPSLQPLPGARLLPGHPQGALVLTLDGFDVQYLVALEKETGRTVWKTDRSFNFGNTDGDLRKAYSTPLFIEAAGILQMVSCGSMAAYAYDPDTGKELWRVRYDGYSNASRPVFTGGLVLVNTGFGKADLWALRPDGRGDVTDTHVAWKCTQGVPLKPSPVASGSLVFMASDSGIATCLEARTGKVVWKERLGGQFSASPVLAAGRVYFPDEEGVTTVIRAGEKFEILAANRLNAGCMASPAVAGGSIFLRTKAHLVRIGK